MLPKRSLIILGAVFLAAVSAIGFGILLENNPRVVTVNDPVPNATSTRMATGGDPKTTVQDPAVTILQIADASATAEYPISPAAPIVPAAYDAKMLEIANLPPPRVVTVVVGTSTTSTVTKVIPTQSPWPVKASYPNAGALPAHRIVAYYGNLYSTQMGILGEYPAAQVLAMLASTTAAWAAADPSTPVIPALDYIAVSAQASAGADGKYRARMPDSQIDKVLSMANQVNGIVFLDLQVGLSDVRTEVPLLEKYLKLPQVELSLDPEFDMHGGARPGTVIGSMDASDINFAAQYLANLVRENNLPPKILVIHRFTQDMVTNYRQIEPLPEVQIVMDMDGFGFPAKKVNTYQAVIESEPVQFTGFKLFYKNDAAGALGHLMTPQEVLKLSPQPSYIQYQ